MAKSTSQKIRVGIFVIVGTIILIVALYAIGKRQNLFTKNIYLYSVFSDVKGLQLGNNVRYSGINVGTVSKIKILEKNKISVQMSIQDKTASFISENAVASIASDGLVGSMVINIIPGKEESSVNVVSGDTIASLKGLNTEEMLGTLSATNENVALLSADLLKISDQILQGKGTIGALVSDTLMLEGVKQTLADLQNASKTTAITISEINRIISKIDYEHSAAAVLLSDTVTAGQTRKLFDNLEKSSQDINKITENFDQYLEELKSGKGALNQLTQDEVLAQDIDTTITSIKEAAEKLNQNMEALKHNFLFRPYFRRLEKQERKEARKK